MPHTSIMPSPEFTILDSGLAFGTGTLHHAWLRLADPQGQETVRTVALKELAHLPIETRRDPDALGKQCAALRRLYNADVDFVFSCLDVLSVISVACAGGGPGAVAGGSPTGPAKRWIRTSSGAY